MSNKLSELYVSMKRVRLRMSNKLPEFCVSMRG